MLIRQATKNDMPQLVDLWWEMHTSHYAYDQPYYKLRERKMARIKTKAYFSNIIDSQDSIFLVADDNGILAGYLCAHIQNKPPVFEPSKRVLIDTTIVREDYRGKGIFTKLYRHMEKSVKQHKPQHIELFVDIDNPAIDLYKNLGFKCRHIKMYREFSP